MPGFNVSLIDGVTRTQLGMNMIDEIGKITDHQSQSYLYRDENHLINHTESSVN